MLTYYDINYHGESATDGYADQGKVSGIAFGICHPNYVWPDI